MTEHMWRVVVEPASKPGVAEPTASMVAETDSLDSALYWASDLAEIGGWEVLRVTVTRFSLPVAHKAGSGEGGAG